MNENIHKLKYIYDAELEILGNWFCRLAQLRL